MRFEEGFPDYKYKITAQGQEAEVFGAAYRELIFEIARGRQDGEIPEFYTKVAAWEIDEDRCILTNQPERQAEVLEAFHVRTSDAVWDVVVLSKEGAPFNNSEIALRYLLGQKALEMAQMIRNSQSAIEQFPLELEGKALEDFISSSVADDTVDESWSLE